MHAEEAEQGEPETGAGRVGGRASYRIGVVVSRSVCACSRRRWPRLQLSTLISQGELTKENVNSKCEAGNTLLLAAIELGHEELVIMLLDEQESNPELGLDVNARNAAGRSPLMLCISEGFSYLVSRLVEMDCDSSIVSNSGETALTLTAA